MLTRIIDLSLRNRLLVLAASAVLFVYGLVSVLSLPVDVFPDLNRPSVTVMSEAPGLAPEEVESLVTWPLETALNGAPSVQRVRSSSGVGLSVLYVEFDWGMDIYRARQLVQERLQLAQQRLPDGVAPVLGPVSSIMGEIMLIGVSSRSGKLEPMELRTLADWRIRQRLLAIPGVSQVTAIGGGVQQYQVLPSPEKMAAFAVSLQEVMQAAASAQSNTGGGFLEGQNQEYLIRNIGRTVSVEAIADTVVTTRNGVPVLLKDVAEVRQGKQPMRGDAGVNAKPAVVLSVQKQPGADTVVLTKQIEQELKTLEGALPADVELTGLFRQATFIENAIRNVEHALRDGALLVAMVLVMFLLNGRTTFITLTAIPLSMIVTAIVLRLLGLSINTMTLGGLAIAIGEMVDDAIVDVENVFRRLRENRKRTVPEPVLKVVFDASVEIRSSIVYATILVILVFVPLFALGGIEGRLFAPIGVAYITSIAASLLVAVSVTPVLCSYLLPSMKGMHDQRESWLVSRLKNFDQHVILKNAFAHQGKLLLLVTGLVVGSFALYPLMGKEFLPEFNEGTATINILSAPGTSLAESNRIGVIAERLLLQVPEVASVGRRTGRAELDEHAEGVHYTELDVDFRHTDRKRETILADVRARLAEIPGVAVSVGQPISHRLDHMLSGVRAQIAVKIFGDDLFALRKAGIDVQRAMSEIAGIVDLQLEKQVLIPQVKIEPKRDKAALYGIRVGELNQFLEAALNGRVVGQVLDGQRSVDVVVRYPEQVRNGVEALQSMLVDTGPGDKVPLSLLADIRESKGPNIINREHVKRRIVVQANVSGRDVGSVVAAVRERINRDVEFAEGMSISIEGQFQSQQEATRWISILSLVSLAAMLLVLYSHFRSLQITAQILLNIPLSFAGGLILTYLLIGKISVASFVGFITLAGIASRNTIMMISHYLHLMRHEGEQFTQQMIVRGSLERLVPVMMTALTAGLALVPLVVAGGEAGKEILYPVAVVILGGLLSSTLLDMAVTPVVFWRYGRSAAARLLAKANVEDTL
ncbi:MAG: CusA/CzcA family heavy metal efflux RND transporter [Oligoflexia bacterium]|nr:CusA/CzcA family heavy metal efflux RND transporter [Oligoflexia bacterium]